MVERRAAALFHETAVSAQQEGTCSLCSLKSMGAKPPRFLISTTADRIWVYNSGLDPQAFSALSPGVVLTAWAIE